MTIDAYASATNYLDHLAPIWLALPPALRGRFYTRSADVAGTAAARYNLTDTIPAGPTPRTIRTLLAASYRDELYAAAERVIFVEHGAGQHYGAAPATNPTGGGRPRVILYLCPNELVAERARPVYPNARIAVVGNPHLDPWHPPNYRRRPASPPVIALAWHWDNTLVPEARTALPHYRRHLGRLRDAGYTVLGHAHPRAWVPLKLAALYRPLGIELVEDFTDILNRADLLIADNTSALYEFASTGRPVVVLNAPYYRRHIHHGLRFWSEADVGIQVDQPTELVAAVDQALKDPPEIRRRRQAIVETVYAHLDGNAAQRAAEEVQRMLTKCPICGSPDGACGGGGHAGTEVIPLDLPTETTKPAGGPMVIAEARVGGGNTRIRVRLEEAKRRGLRIIGDENETAPEPKARTAPNKARTSSTTRNKTKTSTAK